MRNRILPALVLGLVMAAVAHSQAPIPGQPKPKDQLKGDPKDAGKGMPEPKSLMIGGKDMFAWIKEVTDPDPTIRENALRILPSFAPAVQKHAAKLLLARMTAEKDPGVRITVFNTAAIIGFENNNDIEEAVRILAVTANTSAPGGLGRLHAVQTLGMIGSKAKGAVNYLVGPPLDDPAYETRRSIARTLGQIAFSETTGPNFKALGALSGTLARDSSASVRMEALQSLVLLGPPWAEVRKPDDKTPPRYDQKGSDIIADNMRTRLVMNPRAKSQPEQDKQVEIWCRVVLMRFDPKEINASNLEALSKHIVANELGPRLQALQAISLFGERAADRLDDILTALEDEELQVIATTLNTLTSMGPAAKASIPALEKLEKRLEKMRDERTKDEQFKKLVSELKPEDYLKVVESLPEEQMRKTVITTIKFIKDPKSVIPEPKKM